MVAQVSRRPSDTYYLDSERVLRTHTSAHQTDLMREGHRAFLCAGDVYRRDSIDAGPSAHTFVAFRHSNTNRHSPRPPSAHTFVAFRHSNTNRPSNDSLLRKHDDCFAAFRHSNTNRRSPRTICSPSENMTTVENVRGRTIIVGVAVMTSS